MKMPAHDIEVTSTYVYAPDGKTILYRSMNEGDITGESYRTEYTDRAAPGSNYIIRSDKPTKEGYVFGMWYYDDLLGRHTSGDTIKVPQQDIIIYGTFYKDDGSTPIPGYHQVEFIWRRAGQTEYYIGHTFAHFRAGDTITYPANPADFVQQGVTYRHVEWSNAPADGKMPDNDLVITSWMQPVKDTYTAKYYAAWNNSSDGIGTQLFRTVDNIQEGSNMTLLAAMPAKTGYLSPGWTRVTYPNYNGNGIPFSYSLDPGTTTINIMKTVGGIIEIYSDLILDNTSDNIPGYRRVEFIWKREDDTSGYIGHMYKHFVPNSTIVFPSDPADYVYNGYTYRHVEWSNVPSGRVMPDDDIVITSNMAKQHPSYKAYYIARWDNDVDGQGTRLCGTYWATEGSNYTIRTDEPVKENYVFTQWEFSYFNGYEFATYVSGDTFVVPFTTTGAINIYGDFILDNQNINIPGYKKVTFIWGPEDNPSEEFGRKYAHFRPGRDIVAPIISNIEESETVYYQHKTWSNMPEFGVMPNEDIVITSYMIKHLRKYITVTYIVTTYNESEEVEKTETFTFREISGLAAVFYVVDAPEGYYFDEWDTTIEVWPEEDITINGSIKYGIPPKDRLYNLRYLVNGEVWRTQQYKYGEGILWPNMTPDVYRYAFNGWSVRPGTRMPMHDLDTNAILIYQDLVVTYYTVSTDSESYAQQFYYNTEPLKFPKDNPSFEAMTFARWNDQNGDPVEEGTEVTENLVLVAEFVDIPSITFYHPNTNPVNKVFTEYYSPDIASRSVIIPGMLSNREGYAVSRYQVKNQTDSWDWTNVSTVNLESSKKQYSVAPFWWNERERYITYIDPNDNYEVKDYHWLYYFFIDDEVSSGTGYHGFGRILPGDIVRCWFNHTTCIESVPDTTGKRNFIDFWPDLDILSDSAKYIGGSKIKLIWQQKNPKSIRGNIVFDSVGYKDVLLRYGWGSGSDITYSQAATNYGDSDKMKPVFINYDSRNQEVPVYGNFDEFQYFIYMTEIAREAFSKCNISQITIPPGIQKIGQAAFYGKGVNLIKLIFFPGEGVLEIGSYAFSNAFKIPARASGLVKLPSRTTKIGDYAFSDNMFTKQFVFPANVNYIGQNVFDNCPNLESIKFKGTGPLTVQSNSFDGLSDSVVFYVDAASNYKNILQNVCGIDAERIIEFGDNLGSRRYKVMTVTNIDIQYGDSA